MAFPPRARTLAIRVGDEIHDCVRASVEVHRASRLWRSGEKFAALFGGVAPFDVRFLHARRHAVAATIRQQSSLNEAGVSVSHSRNQPSSQGCPSASYPHNAPGQTGRTRASPVPRSLLIWLKGINIAVVPGFFTRRSLRVRMSR